MPGHMNSGLTSYCRYLVAFNRSEIQQHRKICFWPVYSVIAALLVCIGRLFSWKFPGLINLSQASWPGLAFSHIRLWVCLPRQENILDDVLRTRGRQGHSPIKIAFEIVDPWTVQLEPLTSVSYSKSYTAGFTKVFSKNCYFLWAPGLRVMTWSMDFTEFKKILDAFGILPYPRYLSRVFQSQIKLLQFDLDLYTVFEAIVNWSVLNLKSGFLTGAVLGKNLV